MMKLMLDEYYNERRRNEQLKEIVDILQNKLEQMQNKIEELKQNYDYVVSMTQNYQDVSHEEMIDEIYRAKQAAAEEGVDFEYDTGRIIPKDDRLRDESHNWG